MCRPVGREPPRPPWHRAPAASRRALRLEVLRHQQRLDPLVDRDEVPHVFWHQYMHDADLNPTTETIIHRTREDGTWFTHCEMFAGRFGVWTRMTLDPQDRPVFVWSELNETGHDVTLCRFVTSAAVPDQAIAGGLRLSASPSPAIDEVALAFDLAPRTPAPMSAWYNGWLSVAVRA